MSGFVVRYRGMDVYQHSHSPEHSNRLDRMPCLTTTLRLQMETTQSRVGGRPKQPQHGDIMPRTAKNFGRDNRQTVQPTLSGGGYITSRHQTRGKTSLLNGRKLPERRILRSLLPSRSDGATRTPTITPSIASNTPTDSANWAHNGSAITLNMSAPIITAPLPGGRTPKARSPSLTYKLFASASRTAAQLAETRCAAAARLTTSPRCFAGVPIGRPICSGSAGSATGARALSRWTSSNSCAGGGVADLRVSAGRFMPPLTST
jgi:hypothetical protein